MVLSSEKIRNQSSEYRYVNGLVQIPCMLQLKKPLIRNRGILRMQTYQHVKAVPSVFLGISNSRFAKYEASIWGNAMNLIVASRKAIECKVSNCDHREYFENEVERIEPPID